MCCSSLIESYLRVLEGQLFADLDGAFPCFALTCALIRISTQLLGYFPDTHQGSRGSVSTMFLFGEIVIAVEDQDLP